MISSMAALGFHTHLTLVRLAFFLNRKVLALLKPATYLTNAKPAPITEPPTTEIDPSNTAARWIIYCLGCALA